MMRHAVVSRQLNSSFYTASENYWYAGLYCASLRYTRVIPPAMDTSYFVTLASLHETGTRHGLRGGTSQA